MDTHTFELNITRLPKPVTTDMSLVSRIGARTYNIAQKNTYGGLVKMFMDGFKIPRKELNDDNVQIIQIDGSKEKCDEIMAGIEGIDSEKLKEFSQGNASFFAKVKKKASDVAASVQEKGFSQFQQTLGAGGIMISMTVSKKKKEAKA